jgi:soluble lytic murein transglycosylase-like protein
LSDWLFPVTFRSFAFAVLITALINCSCYGQEVQSISDPYCFGEAGALYGISPLLLWSISRHESNHSPTAIHSNPDGSFDFCHMQINSSWARVIGMRSWMSLGDPCYCTKVGAWILAQCIKRYAYTWRAVGCYNASSKDKQDAYARKIAEIINMTYHRSNITRVSYEEEK